ncbi:uncharacterized protein LOC108198056 [Daucus carota subsp. sativus]|uniref:uncharacterized protein LOC108198056 n=1 Tax=Daucus carota subsp. sativus TaxID=79200 RepID=UPI0030838B77
MGGIMCISLVMLVPPHRYMEKICKRMPLKVKYVTNDGDEFLGYYDRIQGRFTGLKLICDHLGIENLNAFTTLVFCYDWTKRFHVSFIDGYNMEINLNMNLRGDALPESIRVPSFFVIEVKPFHMLPYCYGVDIPVEFKRVTEMWGRNVEIRVYKGDISWTLSVHKRADWKCTCILNGWTTFRDDVQLGIGDKLYFQWKDESYKFTFEVVKAGN